MTRKKRGDIRQMQIDWNGVQSTPPVGPAELPQDTITVDSPPPVVPATEQHQPFLRLRWDFRTHFPDVLPEALDSGAMSAEDNLPHNVDATHQEHRGKMLGVLSDLDAAMKERRGGAAKSFDPKPDSLDEPTRLRRWYSTLLGVYEEWFGAEAAEAFDRAVRAWHAHIEVVLDRDDEPVSTTLETPDITAIPPLSTETQESPVPLNNSEVAASPVWSATPSHALTVTSKQRVIARMPVPKPLAAAVEEGRFGWDEQGRAIYPSDDEVYDITVNHAEEIIDMMQPHRGQAVSSSMEDGIQAALTKYAEDFGKQAAEQLQAYCRRQARVRDNVPSPYGR